MSQSYENQTQSTENALVRVLSLGSAQNNCAMSIMQVTLAFPAVLERLDLAPFDLAKLIHPFQRDVPGLPAELNRHLFLVEERILEVRLLIGCHQIEPRWFGLTARKSAAQGPNCIST